MHLLVTDRLACPRCGPAFGLILLARRMVDRRVLEGDFGCANCRTLYPVEGGFADFTAAGGAGAAPAAARTGRASDPWGAEGDEAVPAGEAVREGGAPAEDPEGALRLAALLGVTGGPGTLLLLGAPTRHAERVAAMLDGVEMVAFDPGMRGREECFGVSRGQAGRQLPFFDATFRGVAVGDAVSIPLDEVFRVAAPGARLVVDLPDPVLDPDSRRRRLAELTERARELLLETDRTAVVTR